MGEIKNELSPQNEKIINPSEIIPEILFENQLQQEFQTITEETQQIQKQLTESCSKDSIFVKYFNQSNYITLEQNISIQKFINNLVLGEYEKYVDDNILENNSFELILQHNSKNLYIIVNFDNIEIRGFVSNIINEIRNKNNKNNYSIDSEYNNINVLSSSNNEIFITSLSEYLLMSNDSNFINLLEFNILIEKEYYLKLKTF